MDVKLTLSKDVNSNANYYFDKSKKLKNKIPGIDKIIEKTKKDIEDFDLKKEEYLKKKEKDKLVTAYRKAEWFDKFRYTRTSSGFLMVFGKDSGSNEVLLKKHTDENDLILHTETPGSPFGVIKDARDKISKEDLIEAGTVVSCFSKQWKRGFGNADAFWVYPEQVSKTANSGEYIAKGSFMVRGTKNFLKNLNLRICLGVKKSTIETEDGESHEVEELFSGSEQSVRKECGSRMIKIEPGNVNYKALNKEVRSRLKTHVEDLPKYIPNGSKILKK